MTDEQPVICEIHRFVADGGEIVFRSHPYRVGHVIAMARMGSTEHEFALENPFQMRNPDVVWVRVTDLIRMVRRSRDGS